MRLPELLIAAPITQGNYMDLTVFLALQVSILPIQAILWYGLYAERQRMQRMLRFAVLKLQLSRR